MASGDFDQAVSRLAQYRPFARAGLDLQSALGDLVLAAAAEADSDGRFDSLASCQTAFKVLWSLDVEIDELYTVRAALVRQKRVRIVGKGLALTPDTLTELQRRKSESATTRFVAFSEWRDYVRARHPVSDAQMAELEAELDTWLGRIIAIHGVEAALILYPENPRAQQLFDAINRLLPDRPDIAAIRDAALPFVKHPTSAQRTFLADRLHVAYFLTVLSIDPAGGQLLRETVRGQRLYLDTNVLYPALGLRPPHEAEVSTLRLLDLSRELGYELAVTPWTISELRASLRLAKAHVSQVPLPRRELADLLATEGDQDEVVSAFWAAYRDRATRPEDFFAFFEQVELLLHGHGIKIVDEGCTAIDRNRDAIDQQLGLLDEVLGDTPRDPHVMEHDVKHRLLIERLRGHGRLSFSNARYWFLTSDASMRIYGTMTVDGEAAVHLPFCVATSSWFQVMRCFTARTEDLDQTVVDLLASPFLSARSRTPSVVVEDVVARIDMATQGDLALATAVLTDTALVAEITDADDDADRGVRIQRAFETKTSELSKDLEIARAREAEATDTTMKALEAIELQGQARRREFAEISILRSQLDGERRERAEHEQALEERLRREVKARETAQQEAAAADARRDEALRAEVAELRSRVEAKSRIIRAVLAGALSLTTIAGAVLVLAGGMVTGRGWIVAVVVVSIVVPVLALRYYAGPKTGQLLATWLVWLVAIAGFVWTVAEHGDNGVPGTNTTAAP